MVPITVPIPGTIVPAAPPRSAPEIVRFLSAQALVCSHRSAGLVSASLVLARFVLAGFVLAGLVLSFMLLGTGRRNQAHRRLGHRQRRRSARSRRWAVGVSPPAR